MPISIITPIFGLKSNVFVDNTFLEKINSSLTDHISELRESIDSANTVFFITAESFDELIKEISSLIESHSIEDYRVKFIVPEKVKSYLLTLRDSVIETEKSRAKLSLGKIDINQHTQFISGILSNLSFYKSCLIEELQTILTDSPKDFDSQKYEEVKSPVEVYTQQYIQIKNQISDISNSYESAQKGYQHIESLRTLIIKHLGDVLASTNACKSHIASWRAIAKDNSENHQPLLDTKQLSKEVNAHTFPKANFDLEFKDLISQLPDEIELPIYGNVGQMIVKKSLIKPQVKSWMQVEILPEIYEIWELYDEYLNDKKVAIGNMLTRLETMAGGDKNQDLSFISRVVERFSLKYEKLLESINLLVNDIQDKLDSNLHANDIFSSNKTFLSAPINSALSTEAIEESPFVKWIKKVATLGKTKVEQYLDALNDRQQVNVSELLIDYIKANKLDKHGPYNSLFLTKAAFGKSLFVRRANLDKIVLRSLDNWTDGYRGGLLIKGEDFSGKTSYINNIQEQINKNTIITLHPGSEIEYNGRKYQNNYSIEDSLNFLKKYNTGERVCIIIDDMCQWKNGELLVAENIAALLKFIDYNNHRFFVIATIQSSQLYHLDRNLQISKSFNTIIDVSEITVEELSRIIDIRHGATHLSMVSEKGDVISPNLFKEYVKKIWKESKGNVGDALRLWALSIHTTPVENQVIFNLFETQNLPDFLTEENAVILKAILLNKNISEYELRSLLGPSFQTTYKDILSRLMSTGVVERDSNTSLIINECLANQLYDKLKCEDYL